MCSTPKPKRKVKVKTGNHVVSILAAMSSEKRLRFAQRANQASERRIEKQQAQQAAHKRVTRIIEVTTKTNTEKPWFYWLLSASFSEIMSKLAKEHRVKKRSH